MIHPRVPQSHAAVADHYDELDVVYRRLWGEHVHHGLWRRGDESRAEAVAALSDLVWDELAVGAGARLIDIGCGYGATARRFAARGARVTGFTLSAAQAAAAPPMPGVSLTVRDWLHNDLPPGEADGAYAIESSEHMVDKAAFFRAAAAALRPGGRLVVCAWLAADGVTDWQVRHLLEPICREGRLPSMGTRADYQALAAAAGLRPVGWHDISRPVARTWTLCLGEVLRAVATDPAMRRLALTARNRVFAITIPRLMLAYRTGAMRYGVFTFVRPG